MNVLVKMLNEKEIEDLRKQFAVMDKDQTGMINIEELEQAMKESNLNIAGEEIK